MAPLENAAVNEGKSSQRGNDDGGEVILMAANNPEEWPHMIVRGTSTDLSAVRHKDTHSSFFTGPRELLTRSGEEGEAPLVAGISCRVQWPSDDDSSGDETATACVGELYITVSQVLFSAQGDDFFKDWAIGATCIHLHAMADEPVQSIYLQVTGGDDCENDLEITLIPLDSESCQSVFDGLCKLVAQHPLQLDDDEGGAGAGFGAGGAGFDMEDMIWAPSNRFGAVIPDDDEDDEEGGASEVERAAMLNRLDSILVVSPDLEIQEGQFDDADEDEEESEM